MPDFERLYYKLFAAMADAADLLEQGQREQARQLLIAAMQSAEEQFLEESEE